MAAPAESTCFDAAKQSNIESQSFDEVDSDLDMAIFEYHEVTDAEAEEMSWALCLSNSLNSKERRKPFLSIIPEVPTESAESADRESTSFQSS
eukprot:CAMPEP_0169336784 /NCGR_PEP_ID=MMETSP1017-20121227/17060_1 /TAXON_ID=342587 /ORGANISM="Karlodinium micrum, Strain CCMP2283" /LENGTH=92 /DNA_ID=CAMNT_0009432261 /DNA_START=57 /DNA_END=335 /DNA_ORIENTATION=+